MRDGDSVIAAHVRWRCATSQRGGGETNSCGIGALICLLMRRDMWRNPAAVQDLQRSGARAIRAPVVFTGRGGDVESRIVIRAVSRRASGKHAVRIVRIRHGDIDAAGGNFPGMVSRFSGGGGPCPNAGHVFDLDGYRVAEIEAGTGYL